MNCVGILRILLFQFRLEEKKKKKRRVYKLCFGDGDIRRFFDDFNNSDLGWLGKWT